MSGSTIGVTGGFRGVVISIAGIIVCVGAITVLSKSELVPGPASQPSVEVSAEAASPEIALPQALAPPPVDVCVTGPLRQWCDPQLRHASDIVEVGIQMGLPRRAWRLALMTAMQESSIRILCNDRIPGSENLTDVRPCYQDHLSVGIFQQQPWWGSSMEERMDPARSARLFYNALNSEVMSMGGWDAVANTDSWIIIARVQKPAAEYADRYQKWKEDAEAIVTEVLKYPDNA